MNENKRNKARLLTTSSLALAAILTMGAGSAWAQATNVSPGDTSTVGSPGTVVTLEGASTTGTTFNATITAQTLTVNSDAAIQDLTFAQELTLAGTGSGNLITNKQGVAVNLINLGNGGTLGIAGSTTSTGQGGNLNIVNLQAGNLEVVNGAFNITRLVLAPGTLVGTDPAFSSKGSYDATQVGKLAVADLSTATTVADATTAGNIIAGMNSHITIGQTDQGAFAEKAILALERYSGKKWSATGGLSAALAVTKNFALDTGASLKVDGTQTAAAFTPATANNIELNANSLLIIDNATAGVGGSAAITGRGGGSAVIDSTANLYIANAKVTNGASTTTVYSGFTGGQGAFNNIYYDTRLITAASQTSNPTAGSLVVNNQYAGAGNSKANGGYADGKISKGMAGAVDGVYLSGRNDVDSSDAGVRFVSRATSYLYLDNGNNDRQVVATLEGAAAMASVAGVQTTAFSVTDTIAGNYNARLSYLRDTAPAAGSEPGGMSVWVNPFYRYLDVDGVGIGRNNTEFESNYGGATIGIDTNVNEMFRLGLAVSVGGGDTESKGSRFNKTDSDFDFWGIGIYGSYTADGIFGLSGDIGYTSTSFDLDQRSAITNKLTADVDSDAWTVGLTGEWRFMTENCLNIIPHIGARYTRLETDSYRVKEKGSGTVFRVSSDKQNIWTFPVGVTFTGDVDTNSGWTIKPMADLGVIFAAGDLDADSKFRVGETGHGGKIAADDVVDAVTFNGLVGLKADAGNGFSVGLDYNLKASDNLTSHGVTGMIRYEF